MWGALIAFPHPRIRPFAMSAPSHDSPTPLAEISQGPSAFEQFLDRYQKHLIALLVLLTLAVAGYVIYDGLREGAERGAGHDLMKATDAAALRKVTEAHPGSQASATAALLLAERLWTEGQKDAAVEALRGVLAQQPAHPAAPAARAQLAAKLMAQGKTAEATKEFETIAADGQSAYLAPYALLCLGDLALIGGNTDQAGKYYDQVKTKFADSDFAKTAADRSASLRAQLPTMIDPPKPPPAPEAPATAPAAPAPAGTAPATPEAATPSQPASAPAAPAPAPAQ